MDVCVSESLTALQNKILENVAVNDDIVCGLCDELIALAGEAGAYQSVAFGYVWRGDHAFYVDADVPAATEELERAQPYLDEKTPSVLLEKYYTLRHVLHENAFDLHAAFHCCLKALAAAEALDLRERIGVNFGNLGTYFLDYACYEEALRYTEKAVEVLRSLPEGNPRVLRLLLSNLVQIYMKLERMDSARETLEALRALPVAQADLKVYVDHGYLIYYAGMGQREESLHHLKELLGGGLLQLPNRAFIIELLTGALEAMMYLAEKGWSATVLTMLRGLMNENEPEPRLSLVKLEIRYTRQFGTEEELGRYYRQYHSLFTQVQENRARLKADGMRARIALEEAHAHSAVSQTELRKLQDLVRRDELTQVYNRHYFNIRMDELLNSGDCVQLGLTLVDIDYFKEYNDGYGHGEGDRTIVAVADCLRAERDEQMMVFRYGGDEFICLSWGLDDQALLAYAKRVSARMADQNIHHAFSRCAERVTLSIGYGVRTVSTKTELLALLEEVDRALYAAKFDGRNNMKSILKQQEMEGERHA